MKEGMDRRGFMRRMGGVALGLGFGVSVFDGIYQRAAGESGKGETADHDRLMKGTVDFMGFRAKEITPNDEFYITSYSPKVPRIDGEKFRLRIEGLVENPYQLSLPELQSMQDKREYITLQCIGNPVGGTAIGNALWEGVTLKKIMERARPKPGILKAAFFAEEGYTDSIPYDLALSPDVFLAHRMNGVPPPAEHGYPLRVIVPGIFGMKNVKWLSKIELTNHDFKGYWEKQGWSDSAVIPTMSEILMPMAGKEIPRGHYVIGGIAFAGKFGISRVEVSTDGGKTWNKADLKPPLSQWAWTLWRYDWSPTGKGSYTLKVRGIDRSGKVQESASLLGRITGSYPDGARGIHAVDVTVT